MFLDPNFHFGLLNSKTLFNTHDYLITHTEKKPVNSLPSPFYCWLPTLLPITWKIVSYICRWIDLRLQIDYEVNGFWAVVMSAQHSEALYTCPVTVVTASCQSSLWGALEPVIRILFQGQGARKFSYAPPSYYQALKELALYFHEKEKKKISSHTTSLISFILPIPISPPLSFGEESWLFTGLYVFSPQPWN